MMGTRCLFTRPRTAQFCELSASNSVLPFPFQKLIFSHSLTQSVTDSLAQLVTHSPNQSVTEPVNESVTQSLSQLRCRSVSQSVMTFKQIQ